MLLRALIKNYGDFLMKKEIKRKGMTAPSCGGGENLLQMKGSTHRQRHLGGSRVNVTRLSHMRGKRGELGAAAKRTKG